MPDLLTHLASLDAGSQAVFLSRRHTRIKEGPTLQYVCRRVYNFQGKGPKLIIRDIYKKKMRWLWSSKRVVRVVYGFTTPLRRQEMMIEILNSPFLIVNLS